MRSGFQVGMLVACLAPAGTAADPVTFCNPLDLDYGWSERLADRHGADPVVVPFNGRYFLFDSWDVAGFRVSDDLLTWRTVPFPPEILPWATHDGVGYCAPAARAHGGWLYFLNMLPPQGEPARLLRTRDPLGGRWEVAATLPGGWGERGDPDLFFDDDGRVFLYSGLATPTYVTELDAATLRPLTDQPIPLRPPFPGVQACAHGIERGRREISWQTDTGAFLDRFVNAPCQEAAIMTKHAGTYYLQYATPGTVGQWYSDLVLTGPSPTGPFTPCDYAPASLKIGGFIGSAGHSNVFQDFHGNWWRITTLWIGVAAPMERRLGLFPLGFDAQGRMFTRTDLGDLPQILPQGPRDAAASYLAGWWVQSRGAVATASASLPDHPPAQAADEDVRTWWSAPTGTGGEWLALDLGTSTSVHALQVNFAEQDTAGTRPVPPGTAYRFLVEASDDGTAWSLLADRRHDGRDAPHPYLPLAQPVRARYVRLTNAGPMPGRGRFAVRDLRVFGTGGGEPPPSVQGLVVHRHGDDDRNATITWDPEPAADGYLLRFGVAPEALHLTIQLAGGATRSLTTHALNRGVGYWWRLDAFNRQGVRPGLVVAESRDPPLGPSP